MKKRQALTSLIICLMCLVLTGCANLSYTGEDYDAAKRSTIQTPEGFFFSTYEKNSSNNINMALGITKTTLDAAMVTYVTVTNNNPSEYSLYQADFVFKDGLGKNIAMIPPSVYINAYQSDQTGAYAGAQALSPTFNQFAQISNNFQQIDNTSPVTKAQLERGVLGRQINDAIQGITQNSMNKIETIPPNTKKSYYIFIERPDNFPITVTYKDLKFTFGSDKTDKKRVFND